jgi:hypothetical protein
MITSQTISPAAKTISTFKTQITNLDKRLTESKAERDLLRSFVMNISENGMLTEDKPEPMTLAEYKAAHEAMKKSAQKILNDSFV